MLSLLGLDQLVDFHKENYHENGTRKLDNVTHIKKKKSRAKRKLKVEKERTHAAKIGGAPLGRYSTVKVVFCEVTVSNKENQRKMNCIYAS